MNTGGPTSLSLAFADIPAPDFADVVIVAVPRTPFPLPGDPAWWAQQVFSVRSAPGWVKVLLLLRQAVVGLIGVDRSDRSVFAVDKVEGEEALIAADDRHLDFRAAVRVDVENRLLSVTTTVKLHGWRGRTYWIPVSVLHGPVTRSMAKRAVQGFVGTA